MMHTPAITPRDYQKTIADKIIRSGKNTLVILPTGMGKTLVAALVVKHFLDKGKKVMLLAPTRPLIDQHAKRLKEYLGVAGVQVTGNASPLQRKEMYKEKLVISTPQCVSNDLERWDFLSDFALIVFDEAHRAVGKYAYTRVAEVAKQNGSQIVGLTASPGGRVERVKGIMDSLSIDEIEIRTEKEKDVRPYVQPLKLEWLYVDLSPEIADAAKVLEEILDDKAETLRSFGIIATRNMARSRLSQIYRALIQHKNLAALGHFSTFYNAFHAAELLETEGPHAYRQFLERLKERKKRVDPRFFRVEILVRGKEHPKMAKLLELVGQRKEKRLIIFAQYRDQVNHIVDVLGQNGFTARRFLGKKEGSAKEQHETIEAFRNGEFDILVASSIGEEGIDVPSADTAILYEPVPSEIRSIQRRGRVARLKGGEVIILVTKGTRDEVFKWVSTAREKKMHAIIKGLKDKKRKKPAGTEQARLSLGTKTRKKKGPVEEQRKISDFFS